MPPKRISSSTGGLYERVPAAEAAIKWERSLRPGQYYSARGGKRPMMHSTQAVEGSPARTWTRGVDGGAWGPQPRSPIPGQGPKPVAVRRSLSPSRKGRAGARNAQKLGRLRSRSEELFRRLTQCLPRLEHLSPPPDPTPCPPAFDVTTLRRQVTSLQDELEARFVHQEELFAQNMTLWDLLKQVADQGDNDVAQQEVDRLHSEMERLQGTLAQLKEQVKKGEGVGRRLKSAQEERGRAQAALHAASQVNDALAHALDGIRKDNRALQAEVEAQTQALQDLQQHIQHCKSVQASEDMEELHSAATQLYAHSKPAMRRALSLLHKAVQRSQALRTLPKRFPKACTRALLRRCLLALRHNIRVSRQTRMSERRRLWDMGREALLAWRQYTDTQRLTQVACKRRVLQSSFTSLRTATQEAQWQQWAQERLGWYRRRSVQACHFRAWRAYVQRAQASQAMALHKATTLHTHHALARWRGRVLALKQQAHDREQQIRAKWDGLLLRTTLRRWRMAVRVMRFERRRLLSRGVRGLLVHTWGRSLQSHALDKAAAQGRHRNMWTGMHKLHRAVVRSKRAAGAMVLQGYTRGTRGRVYHNTTHTQRHRAQGRREGREEKGGVRQMRGALYRWARWVAERRTRQANYQRAEAMSRSRRLLTVGLRTWQEGVGTHTHGRAQRAHRRAILLKGLHKWKRRAAQAQAHRDLHAEAQAMQRVSQSRLLRRVLCAWQGLMHQARHTTQAATVLHQRRQRALLRRVLCGWQRAIVLDMRQRMTTLQAEHVSLEAQVKVDDQRLLASTLSTNTLLQHMATLQREVDEAQEQLGHKLTHLHTLAQQQASLEEGTRTLEDQTSRQARELRHMQQQTAMQDSRAQQASLEDRTLRLEALEVLLERQRSMSQQLHTSQATIATLQQRLDTAKSRECSSLLEAQQVTRKYRDLALSKTQEVEALGSSRSEVADRIRAVELKVQQVLHTAHTEREARERRVGEQLEERAALQLHVDAARAREREAQLYASSLSKPPLSTAEEHTLLSALHGEVTELRRSVGGGGRERGKENWGPGAGAGGGGGGGEMSESLGLYLDLRGQIEQLQARIGARGEGGGAAATVQRQGQGKGGRRG